ncbi:MAG: helix-turn-helix transcriptional regulator [Chloroflexi bacterium]|nr:helix-turn-helix transcriptional regulator [Chloroflexota bacterium]
MARQIGLRGDRILRLRERLGYTQMEAAYKCGMNQGNLSQIERGQRTNVQMETLVGLAEGLKTTVEYLIGATNDPTPRPQAALDRLTEDEARWLILFRELSPFSRETVFALAQRLADSDRAAAEPTPDPVERAERQ